MSTPFRRIYAATLMLFLFALSAAGQNPKAQPRTAVPPLSADSLKAIPLRNIGPCITPGRISDIAINPKNRNVWYVTLASGGVWKTSNRGMNWTPIFDNEVSYSIGCVTVDAKNPDTVWVGTGENNSQRSVGFGDGVYKSTDGGKKWAHVGLKNSEHIAKILIDPRDSDVVYVASQGPLWSPGGDRGLYKSTDGGKSWKVVLEVSENTGITDVCFDTKNPDVLYASSYQRRRHVGVLIGGGPESAIHKSEDAGKTWKKLTKGLPEADVGRIALAVSPQKPEVVYAHVQEAAKKGRGFYRSEDHGESWTKMGDLAVQAGMYYGEIYCDPHKFDRLYVMDMQVRRTEDGGKSFQAMQWSVHVDHHALEFDPNDPNYLLSGNDGGLYESFDNGRTWRHFDTFSSTQFYRITVDDAVPFYNVYGGTQDNGTMGGPSRSRNRIGVRTSDWGIYGGGDGMQPRVEPGNPDIVYTMSQGGSLVRLEKQLGRNTGIRPGGFGGGVPKKGGKGGDKKDDKKDDKDDKDKKEDKEEPVAKGGPTRWNWDSAFIISPHSATRLYFAGNRLYRSDDRGTNWKTVSPDLTRNLDATKVEVMGKLWGPEAVARNMFTTPLSIISSVAESPVKEGLLYVGTDDGLIQVSEDGGTKWDKIESFPGVPKQTYVSEVFPSHHDANTVYAAFNNHQRGDFKPYLLKSPDRGQTWINVAGNLPDRHFLWSFFEDPVNKDLLFAGTEFALFVTLDGGKNWAKLPGTPPVPFRDLELQKREGDLVCGTFGRGIYILDDYAPLRHLTPEAREKAGVLLPVRKTRAYVEAPYARTGGEFTAPNPPSGALLTYHLGEKLAGDAKLVVRVANADGKTVREVPATGTGAGLHRVNWDLRTGGGGGGMGKGPRIGGDLVTPGRYTARLVKLAGKDETVLGEPQTFEVVPLDGAVAAQPE